MKLKNLSSVILATMMAATSVPATGLIAPYSNLTAYAIEAEDESTYDNGVVAEGTCGENLKWTLYSQDEVCLAVSGYGKMPDWESYDDTPWAEYCDSVCVIRVECGVQNISENAFSGIDAFIFEVDNPNCVIPDSETAIPECAEIWGYDESTALAYAEKYGRECDSIGTADEYHVAEGDINGLEWILWSNGDLGFYGYGDIAAENGVYPWDRVADSIKTIIINPSVRSIDENAFINCTNLEIVLMYTPDCKIADSETVLPKYAPIIGYDDSTAHVYAEKYGREFYSIGKSEGSAGEGNSSVVEGDGVIAEGMLGENLKWTIDSQDEVGLVVSGYGEMPDWESFDDTPWAEYCDSVGIIRVECGVQNVSENAFSGIDAFLFIVDNPNCVIPDSETAIPECAKIWGYDESTALAYAEKYGRECDSIGTADEYHVAEGDINGLEWILWSNGDLGFYGYGDIAAENGVYPWDRVADSIKTIIINTSVSKIGEGAFTKCTNLESVLMYTPDCQIADSADVFPSNVLLQVGDGSTAEEYAVKYNLTYDVYNFFTASGKIGDNLTWVLFDGGSLRIYGEGNMIDLGGVSPWAEYEDEITRVQINHEVTSVDEAAFKGCDNIAEMIVLNPECKFAESEEAIPEDTVIWGTEGSSALMYAQMFGRNFKTLSSEITAPEEEESPFVAEGKCGETLDWNIQTDKRLFINGDGVMDSYMGYSNWEEYTELFDTVEYSGELYNYGEYAFYNCKNIKTIELAPVIGAHAFEGCSNIESTITPAGFVLEQIGDYAFYGCDNLGGLIIENPECIIADSPYVFPENMTIFGVAGSTAQAHAEKYGLEFVEIESEEQGFIAQGELGENLTWELLDDGMLYIDGEGEMLECGEGGYPWSEFSDKITAVNFGKGVTSVGAYAFYNCKNITTIDTTKVIGEHAFDGCISVESVGSYMGNEMTVVGDYAFNNCGLSLYTFDDPNCVIADSEFVFPDGATIWGHVGSTAQAYAEKYGLDFVIIEEEPVTTTAPDSDSETTTTTTTTPNDSESELPQTGFSKAYDYLAFSAGVMALCGIYAMKKGKKKEDEE